MANDTQVDPPGQHVNETVDQTVQQPTEQPTEPSFDNTDQPVQHIKQLFQNTLPPVPQFKPSIQHVEQQHKQPIEGPVESSAEQIHQPVLNVEHLFLQAVPPIPHFRLPVQPIEQPQHIDPPHQHAVSVPISQPPVPSVYYTESVLTAFLSEIQAAKDKRDREDASDTNFTPEQTRLLEASRVDLDKLREIKLMIRDFQRDEDDEALLRKVIEAAIAAGMIAERAEHARIAEEKRERMEASIGDKVKQNGHYKRFKWINVDYSSIATNGIAEFGAEDEVEAAAVAADIIAVRAEDLWILKAKRAQMGDEDVKVIKEKVVKEKVVKEKVVKEKVVKEKVVKEKVVKEKRLLPMAATTLADVVKLTEHCKRFKWFPVDHATIAHNGNIKVRADSVEAGMADRMMQMGYSKSIRWINIDHASIATNGESEFLQEDPDEVSVAQLDADQQQPAAKRRKVNDDGEAKPKKVQKKKQKESVELDPTMVVAVDASVAVINRLRTNRLPFQEDWDVLTDPDADKYQWRLKDVRDLIELQANKNNTVPDYNFPKRVDNPFAAGKAILARAKQNAAQLAGVPSTKRVPGRLRGKGKKPSRKKAYHGKRTLEQVFNDSDDSDDEDEPQQSTETGEFAVQTHDDQNHDQDFVPENSPSESYIEFDHLVAQTANRVVKQHQQHHLDSHGSFASDEFSMNDNGHQGFQGQMPPLQFHDSSYPNVFGDDPQYQDRGFGSFTSNATNVQVRAPQTGQNQSFESDDEEDEEDGLFVPPWKTSSQEVDPNLSHGFRAPVSPHFRPQPVAQLDFIAYDPEHERTVKPPTKSQKASVAFQEAMQAARDHAPPQPMLSQYELAEQEARKLPGFARFTHIAPYVRPLSFTLATVPAISQVVRFPGVSSKTGKLAPLWDKVSPKYYILRCPDHKCGGRRDFDSVAAVHAHMKQAPGHKERYRGEIEGQITLLETMPLVAIEVVDGMRDVGAVKLHNETAFEATKDLGKRLIPHEVHHTNCGCWDYNWEHLASEPMPTREEEGRDTE